MTDDDPAPLKPQSGLSRRGFLLQAGGVTLATTTAACSPGGPSVTAPTAATEPSAPTPPSRVLLAYFSRAGENYYYGGRRDLAVGNTEVLAGLIGSTLPVDTYRIEAADPYPASYDATVDRNAREQRDDARPALAAAPPSLDAYDVVLLGSPVWNVRAPMIMHSLLDQLDLRGKTILPFVTYAVSGMGRVADEYAAAAPEATTGNGLAVQGEKANDAGNDVTTWLQNAGLLAPS